MQTWIGVFAFLLPVMSIAALTLPRDMNAVDRKKTLEIIGLSSSMKLLGNPFPLGGYSGVEIGYGVDILPLSELSTLGSKQKIQSEATVSYLTLGKGLYHNLDLALQFTPLTQSEDVSTFGGQLRWGFYQAEYLPAYLSLVISGSTSNFVGKLSTISQNADLVAGFSVGDLTVYTGIGIGSCTGNFFGGSESVNESEGVDGNNRPVYRSKKETVSSSHYLAGLNFRFDQFFLAMQLDRYTQASYSARLGIRF